MDGAVTPRGRSTNESLSPLLRRLRDLGLGPRAANRRLAGPFPVAGPATWSNDWHALRCVPTPHLHQGVDIFAPRGTPLVAVAAGRITQKLVGEVSGLSVEITDREGIQYFYAHLDGFPDDLQPGRRVSVGDVVGFVGDSGNARGTSPHLHLEVQPGGVPSAPKPWVDEWLEMAEKRGPKLVRRVRARMEAREASTTRAQWRIVTFLTPTVAAALVEEPGAGT